MNDGQRSECKRHRLLLVLQAAFVLLKSGVRLFTPPLLPPPPPLLMLLLLMLLLPPPPLLLLRMKNMPGRGNTVIANSGFGAEPNSGFGVEYEWQEMTGRGHM